jgi:hypothetical protein
MDIYSQYESVCQMPIKWFSAGVSLWAIPMRGLLAACSLLTVFNYQLKHATFQSRKPLSEPEVS